MERLLVEMGSIYSGGKVYFAESLDTFLSNLSEASPSVFLGCFKNLDKISTRYFVEITSKEIKYSVVNSSYILTSKKEDSERIRIK